MRFDTCAALSIALLLVVAPVAGVVVPVVGAAQTATDEGSTTAGATEIESCTVIDRPGNYVLTEDVENSSAAVCIDIRSGDVSFDGNGHVVAGNLSREAINETIFGPPPRTRVGVGVNVRTTERVENVSVANVTVSNWNHGVLAENVTGGRTAGVTAYDNGGGIIYDSSSDVAVTESNSSNNLILGTIVDSRSGIQTADNAISNSTFRDNGVFGAAMFLSNGSTIANNTATGNLLGVYAYATRNTTIEDNAATSNDFGVAAEGFRQNESNATEFVENASVENATNVTESLDEEAPEAPAPTLARDNLVVDNDLTNNTHAGLALIGADENLVIRNNVSGTGPAPAPAYPFPARGSAGVVTEDALNNTVVSTTARDVDRWVYAGFNDTAATAKNVTTDTGRVSFDATDVGVGPVEEFPEPPAERASFGAGLNATALGENESLRVAFHYEEATLNEWGLNESSLTLYRYDREAGEWTAIEGSAVDAEANVVTATVGEADGIVAPLANDTGT